MHAGHDPKRVTLREAQAFLSVIPEDDESADTNLT